MVVHTSNPSAVEAEQVEFKANLVYREFQRSQGYIENLITKYKNRQTKKKDKVSCSPGWLRFTMSLRMA